MEKKSKPREEQWTSERCFITELLNDESSPEVSLARARVEPEMTTQLHSLSVLEWYVIESGCGLMRVGDDAPYPVTAGDVVKIASNSAQRITNTGADDLLFLCVCVPRFTLTSYTSLE